MARSFFMLFLLSLAGCASVRQPAPSASPCDASEASYECQVERYNHVNDP